MLKICRQFLNVLPDEGQIAFIQNISFQARWDTLGHLDAEVAREEKELQEQKSKDDNN